MDKEEDYIPSGNLELTKEEEEKIIKRLKELGYLLWRNEFVLQEFQDLLEII